MASTYVFSLNVRGLRRKTKRKQVFSFLKREKYDIVCLQETHITDDIADEWKNEWRDGFVFCPGTSKSCGQVILLNKSIEENFTVVMSTQRILAVAINIKDKPTLVCNIYAPNENTEKEFFFKELQNKIKDAHKLKQQIHHSHLTKAEKDRLISV